jgi:hypothetical protein
MDLKRIEPKFLKENQLVGLGFYGKGFIFFRVNGVEFIRYRYSEVPGALTADQFYDSSRLSSSAMGQSIDNILRVLDCDHLYQVFMGWSPGVVQQYLSYPYETTRRNLDVKAIFQKAPFGYIDGYDSPYDCPSPETEIFIPINIDVGFSWYNPGAVTVTPTLNLIIRRLGVEPIDDPQLIQRILTGSQPCRLTTLGGIGSQMNYNVSDYFPVDFIKLDASLAEITAAVKQ